MADVSEADNVQAAQVRVRDCQKMKYQNSDRCANCYQDISNPGAARSPKKFNNEMHLKAEGDGGIEDMTITLVEALNFVFNLHKRSHSSLFILDEDKYSLCRGCYSVFSSLFQLFAKFSQLSSPPSYLSTILDLQPLFNRILILLDEDQIKTEDDDDGYNQNNDFNDGEELSPDIIPVADETCGEKTHAESEALPWVDHMALVETEYQVQSDDSSGADDISDDLDSDPDYDEAFGSDLLQHNSGSGTESNDSSDDDLTEESSGAEDELLEDKNGETSTRKKDDIIPAAQKVKPKRIRIRSRKKPKPTAASGSEVGPDGIKVKRKRDGTVKRYKCPVCSEMFSRTDHVKRHMRCHSEVNFTCPICSAGYKHRLRMEDHVKTHDPNYTPPPPKPKLPKKERDKSIPKGDKPNKKGSQGPIECEICGKPLANPHNLKLHLESHKGLDECETYVCEICGSTFKTKESLKKHGRLHGNVTRDFLCNACGFSFKRAHHLREHEALKHGDQPREFICPEPNCGKAFHRQRSLRQHRKLHAGTKYACEYGCGALFTAKYNRKVHQEKSCSKAPPQPAREGCGNEEGMGLGLGHGGQGQGKAAVKRRRRNKTTNASDKNISDLNNTTNNKTGINIHNPEDPNLIPSNSNSNNSDHPLNFSPMYSSRNPSSANNTFPFNFSAPLFPLSNMGLDCPTMNNFSQLPSSTSSSPIPVPLPARDPSLQQQHLPFSVPAPPYSRGKVNINSSSSMSSSTFNSMNPNPLSRNTVSNIQHHNNDYGYN